jgi:hypothetical protein
LVLGAVWLLNANSRYHGNDPEPESSGAACDVCQEMLVGSFSCAVQGGEVVAQVNFQGTGDLTPSPTGAGIVVLAGVPGGTVSVCESLAAEVASELDDAGCAVGRVLSPIPDQRVFDFACRAQRSSLVGVMGDISQAVISASP